jgi:hypothetical protein
LLIDDDETFARKLQEQFDSEVTFCLTFLSCFKFQSMLQSTLPPIPLVQPDSTPTSSAQSISSPPKPPVLSPSKPSPSPSSTSNDVRVVSSPSPVKVIDSRSQPFDVLAAVNSLFNRPSSTVPRAPAVTGSNAYIRYSPLQDLVEFKIPLLATWTH